MSGCQILDSSLTMIILFSFCKTENDLLIQTHTTSPTPRDFLQRLKKQVYDMKLYFMMQKQCFILISDTI